MPITPRNYSSVNIRNEDRPILDGILERDGKTAVTFMSEVLAKEACTHPVKQRIFVEATYDQGGIVNVVKPMTVHGYYCKECKRTILPAPIL